MNGKALASKMAERGLTVEALAAAIRRSPSYVRMFLNGLRPSPATLLTMTLVLQCGEEDLLYPDENAGPFRVA
jgi:transcriptional regulator with XRE-family HTH domain